jgi:hypothetical protein
LLISTTRVDPVGAVVRDERTSVSLNAKGARKVTFAFPVVSAVTSSEHAMVSVKGATDVRLPAESESPVPTVISSTAPVPAVVLPRIRLVAMLVEMFGFAPPELVSGAVAVTVANPLCAAR